MEEPEDSCTLALERKVDCEGSKFAKAGCLVKTSLQIYVISQPSI